MCGHRWCIPGPTQTGMGWSLPPESIAPALEDWAKWGQARHSYFLRAADLARAIAFVAETPRGGVRGLDGIATRGAIVRRTRADVSS